MWKCENSIRVPCIIFDPTRPDQFKKREELILNIDIAPTIPELAGIIPSSGYQGKSMVQLLESNKPVGELSSSSNFYTISNIPKSEGVRMDIRKYFHNIDHPEPEELYALENDPQEIQNLFKHDPLHGIVDHLRQKCNDFKRFYIETKNDFG